VHSNFIVYLAAALLWARLPRDMLELPVGAAAAAAGTVGARLVLNLREAVHAAPRPATFAVGPRVDIGWTPHVPGRAVRPMWPDQPLEQRLRRTGVAGGANEISMLEFRRDSITVDACDGSMDAGCAGSQTDVA
jgi:hypothetical protein